MYLKKECSPSELIALLQNRGLHINSMNLASLILKNIGYQTFDSYCYPFLLKNSSDFRPNTSLSQIWSVILLDRHLRSLLFPVLLEIELALKTRWTEFIVKQAGPFGYLDCSLFFDQKIFTRNLKHSTKSWCASNDAEIKAFRNKYPSQMPPVWQFVRVLTFGELSHWITSMTVFLQKRFFESLQLPSYDNFRTSTLNVLTLARNNCAHGQRIWNRSFPAVVPQEFSSSENKHKIAAVIRLIYFIADSLEINIRSFQNTLSVVLSEVPRWQMAAMGYTSRPLQP